MPCLNGQDQFEPSSAATVAGRSIPMERIRRSWELGKASWKIMTSNPQLLLFPLIATIALLISSAAIGGMGWGVIYALGLDLSTEMSSDNAPVKAVLK